MTAELLLAAGAALALALAVLAYVGRPLLGGALALPPPDPRTVALLAEREALLATLRDLDADHAAGRMAGADYEALRAEAVARGARVLAALDAVSAEADGRAAALTAALEAEVRAAGGGAPEPRAREAGPEGGGEAAAAPAGAGRFCTACGQACAPADRFCGRCGAALGAVVDVVGEREGA